MHVYLMVKKLIPFFFIFVTSILPLFGENVHLYHHPDTGIFLQINSDPRYQAEIQLEERFSYGISLAFFRYFGITIDFQLYNVHPSSIAGGSQYRGFYGLGPGIGVFGRYRFRDSIAGVRGFFRFFPRYASYYSINTSFFYFAVEGGAGAEFWLSKNGDWLLFAAVPVTVNLRRDLGMSAAPGLSLSFHHRLLPWPYGKEAAADE